MDPAPTIRWRSFDRPDPALLEELSAARTPDLANALGAAAVADPVLRPAWRGARVFGPALTVKLSGTDNLGAIYAALHARAGDVLVIETAPQSTSAIAGELLARGARAHGVQGIVVDGAIRDVLDLESMRMPVWSRCICPRQASKNQDASVGFPVSCAGRLVEPGDLVMADDDGIVFASHARLREVVTAIHRGMAMEKSLAEDVALDKALQGIIAKVRVEQE
jgi:4-hydroxy-4-methyl-2-oxoglutarate aldolase